MASYAYKGAGAPNNVGQNDNNLRDVPVPRVTDIKNKTSDSNTLVRPHDAVLPARVGRRHNSAGGTSADNPLNASAHRMVYGEMVRAGFVTPGVNRLQKQDSEIVKPNEINGTAITQHRGLRGFGYGFGREGIGPKDKLHDPTSTAPSAGNPLVVGYQGMGPGLRDRQYDLIDQVEASRPPPRRRATPEYTNRTNADSKNNPLAHGYDNCDYNLENHFENRDDALAKLQADTEARMSGPAGKPRHPNNQGNFRLG